MNDERAIQEVFFIDLKHAGQAVEFRVFFLG